MSEKDIIKKYIEEIENLSKDINIKEINSHLCYGKLSEWLIVWQTAINQCVKNIKEVL